MKRMILVGVTALIVGLLVPISYLRNGSNSVQANPDMAAGFRKKLSFTLAPGASKYFLLPQNGPVHISVSYRWSDGGTQTPSELMSALVEQNPASHAMTWIGTNSDATMAASDSLDGTIMASILAGPGGTAIATLEVGDTDLRTVRVTEATGVSAAGNFFVVMWY